MKLVLIEDQILLSSTLIKALGQIPDISIAAYSDKASEAINLCRMHHPDLVIMDIFTNGGSGIEATAQIKQLFPEIKVFILTGIEDDHLIKAAEDAGADIFARKSMSLDELTEFIQLAHKPYRIFPGKQYGTGKPVKLSDLEIRIIRLLAKGKSTREIASDLFLSYGTVRVYISHLYMTTGFKSRAQLVAFALRNNMIPSG